MWPFKKKKPAEKQLKYDDLKFDNIMFQVIKDPVGAPEIPQSLETTFADVSIQVAFQDARGRKKYQEDRISIQSSENIFWSAIFDGHGGSTVSEYCFANFFPKFNETFQALDDKSPKKLEAFTRNIFLDIDKEIEELDVANQGTTATILALTKLEDEVLLNIGHAGDSRLIIFEGQNESILEIDPEANVKSLSSQQRTDLTNMDDYFTAAPVSKEEYLLNRTITQFVKKNDAIEKPFLMETADHDPKLPSEKSRLENEGHTILGGRIHGLAISRALGDHSMKKKGGIIAEPDVSVIRLKETFLSERKEIVVIMASDGLWIYMNSHKVRALYEDLKLRDYTIEQICQVLTDTIMIDYQGMDNLAITILRISLRE